MESLELECPCCKAHLTVNKENGHVLHAEEFKKGPAGFDDFLNAQRNRKEALAKKFETAKENSKNRMKSIEEKIAWAQQRSREEGDTPENLSRPKSSLED